MKKVIVTNNKKVESKYAGKAEVKMMENASRLNVLKEGRKIASDGGRLLVDPTRTVGAHYNSLVFLMDDGNRIEDEKSLSMLNKCIDIDDKAGNIAGCGKEPMLAWILQNKDLEAINGVFR